MLVGVAWRPIAVPNPYNSYTQKKGQLAQVAHLKKTV